MTDLIKPICQVGAARSGTNLLANILRHHEDLAFWPRPKYVWRHGQAWWPDDCLTAEHARPRVIRYIREHFARYLQKEGRSRFFENTQANVLALPFVNAVLPDCKIIHIIRDGRDNVASQRFRFKTPPKSTAAAVRQRVPGIPITDWLAYVPEFLQIVWNRIKKEEYLYTMGPKIKNWQRLRRELDILEYTAINWRECVTAAKTFGRTLGPDRYHEVRFDQLLSHPDAVLDELLEFLELKPSQKLKEAAHSKIDPSRSGKRACELTEQELDRIMPHMEPLLSELGML